MEELERRYMPSPVVLGLTVNPLAQSAQASMVTKLELDFNEPVTLGSGSITIALHPNVTVNGVPGQTVGTIPSLTATPDGPQDFFLHFNGPGVNVSASIADGVYDLTVHGALIQGADGPGNSDFTATFFRMFGDTQTGGTNFAAVEPPDKEAFDAAYNTYSNGITGPGYTPLFDWNADGAVNNLDKLHFNRNVGQTWSWQNLGPPMGSVAAFDNSAWQWLLERTFDR